MVRFSWSVDPPTSLYRASGFSIDFPRDIELSRVSPWVVWTAGLLCLHSRWLLLQPCEVRLPVTLPAGEREFWERLLTMELATLESTRAAWGARLRVALHDSGPPFEAGPEPAEQSTRWAAAFSSGKDSLVQAAMLRELTDRPVLVYVDSDLPGLHDNLTPRRRQALDLVERDRRFELVRVRSDYRSTWDNYFAIGLGYDLGVSEMSDTFLYLAATLIVAASRGMSHVALAAQTEICEAVEIEGSAILMDQFMYSSGVMRALDALLVRHGTRYSSLICPLFDTQVTELLWTRYRDLRHAHHSCWECDEEGRPCNSCPKCTLICLSLLAVGESPSRIGGDPMAVLESLAEWRVREPSDFPAPLTPRSIARLSFDAQRNRRLQETAPWRVLLTLFQTEGTRALSRRAFRAVRIFQRLREGQSAARTGGAAYRAGFLALVDPAIRTQLESVIAARFPAEPAQEHGDLVELIERTAGWVAAPLAAPT